MLLNDDDVNLTFVLQKLETISALFLTTVDVNDRLKWIGVSGFGKTQTLLCGLRYEESNYMLEFKISKVNRVDFMVRKKNK